MASVSGAHSSRTLLDIIPQYSKSKSSVEVGSVRLKSLVGVSNVKNHSTSRFPKLEECAHFHYEHLDLQPIQLSVVSEEGSKTDSGVTLRITSGSECWQIQRTFDHFSKLDEQLHQCVFDRKFSELTQLSLHSPKNNAETQEILDKYVQRLSSIWSGCSLSCGPVLSWFELDNRGRRIVASGHGINTPAVAAAFATTPYTASATDELSFQIGDMISVIDMPPAEESSWWRGKRGFVVGFFPSNCVAVITDKIPTEITLAEPSKPVLRKHGKLIAFFRAFILSRPSRRRLKQTGILKERVFGCDLSEHLLNTSREIPLVLKCCAEFIEAHGIVDGIYRLSGVTSNIQRLRSIFDEDRIPVLEEESGLKQDVHGVASLLKMYFRELPNPLCTYQLYDEFVAAVQSPNDQRLDNMRRVVQKLPPPHYRTLEYLMGHLGRVCGHSTGTGMTARNVAIVWAPNLLRCRSLDQGVAALQGVGVQAVVTEFLILYAPHIFSTPDGEKVHLRPKSLAVSSPTKLLTLEEAMARGQHSPATSCVSEMPPEDQTAGHSNFHTVIDLPRKRQPLNWRTIFTPRRNLQPKSPRRLKRKTIIVKSTELISSSLNGERFAAQASVPSTVAHSRSVSHDSYFDTNFDSHKSSSSLVETQQEGLSLSLDLSELQMNFELEESEMRIFSEDETNQLFSSGASIAFGVLENDMNLEKRFSTQNLRYIDSYSPDPMESPDSAADVQTPGYQPLLATPGSYENLRVSGCFDSASSKKSETSPFSYEKLMESPGNIADNAADIVQRRENELYESCTPRGSTANLYESMDLELYEPVAPAGLPSQVVNDEPHYENDNGNVHYENETVARSVAPADPQSNIYEDVRCVSTADIYEQVSNFKNSVNEVNSLANESLTSTSRSYNVVDPEAKGGKQYHSMGSLCDPLVTQKTSVFLREGSPSSVSKKSDSTLCEEKDSCDKVSLTASSVQDTMISSMSTMVSSASEAYDHSEAPDEEPVVELFKVESVPMETSPSQDVSHCSKLIDAPTDEILPRGKDHLEPAQVNVSLKEELDEESQSSEIHRGSVSEQPVPCEILQTKEMVSSESELASNVSCSVSQEKELLPCDSPNGRKTSADDAFKLSLEDKNVPDARSRNLDGSDEISKTYYQNFNLSKNEELLCSSKDGRSKEFTISELTQYDCREPNLIDNVECDSNLGADNLKNICEDNNRKIGSLADVEKSVASPQKCSVVSEVLKRDWVGRAKDGQGRSSVVVPRPVSPTELPTSEPEKEGKAEKLKKFVELDLSNVGDMGARSKLKLSVGSLNREDISPGSESDLERRERIERYKEERRNFFRNKYKTDALNNNEDRDEELIRRIKQKTKKEMRGMDVSPCDSESAESKKSPAKVTVNISYSPTKANAGIDLDDISYEEAPQPPESRFEEDPKPA